MMKRVLRPLSILYLLSCLTVPVAVGQFTPLTAEEIVGRCAEAMGGRETIDSLTTLGSDPSLF
ncbi:hypothetical protein ACFLSZ_00170 [Candidatus Bipolaricaulota bacterium]